MAIGILRGIALSVGCFGQRRHFNVAPPAHHIVRLSICVCLLRCLSSGSYSFQCTGLSPPWLSLFLGILFDAFLSPCFFCLFDLFLIDLQEFFFFLHILDSNSSLIICVTVMPKSRNLAVTTREPISDAKAREFLLPSSSWGSHRY